MYQHVEDLEDLIKKLNKPVHLIGHSYGAFICLILAMKSPHLINSLILSEPPVITLYVSNSPKPLEILKLLFSRPKTAIALIKLGAKGIEPATKEVKRDNMKKAIEIFGKATLGADTYANLSDSRMEQVYKNVIKAEFVGSGFPPLDESKIREIKVPTLLISGRNSPKIFHFLLDRLMELIPNSKRKIESKELLIFLMKIMLLIIMRLFYHLLKNVVPKSRCKIKIRTHNNGYSSMPATQPTANSLQAGALANLLARQA